MTEFPGIMPNPTYGKVMEGAAAAKENQVEMILGIGGGSVMDCCKAISLVSRCKGDAWENFWERRGTIDFDPIPVGVIVTTAGTGSECNGVAVITNEGQKVKTGYDYPKCNPIFALMDPTYTFSVPPPELMAAGAFDSFSHMMETYFSEPDGQNVSDEIAEALMRSVIKNIRQAVRDPRDYTARSNLLWASTLSENRLIKLGKKCDFTCHLIEHQLSAYTDCSHSQGMAVLHPAYYRHIYRDGLAKFARFARHVWMMPGEGRTEEELAEAGIDALADFIRETALPTSLREMGIKTRDSLRRSRIPAIIRRGHTGSSAPGRAWDSSGNVSDTGIQTRIDEIYLWTEEFRVFQNMHPDIRLTVINANAAAQGMIRHVKRERKSES